MSKEKPAVEVRWIDSMKSSGWHEHKLSNLECRSVGILYEKHKDRIVLALNSSQYVHGDYIEIPMIAVKKIRRLK